MKTTPAPADRAEMVALAWKWCVRLVQHGKSPEHFISAIATFAGHANPATTLQYIHLSGCDLAAKLARGMEQIHGWRIRTLVDLADLGEPPS